MTIEREATSQGIVRSLLTTSLRPPMVAVAVLIIIKRVVVLIPPPVEPGDAPTNMNKIMINQVISRM